MKLYKLLFFFFALITFNSCAEYVDYGVKPEEPTNYNFKASLKATTAKYVGDEFEFMGTLNDVDVTKSVKFKVNGNSILGKTYIPQNEGDYTVTASYEVAGLDPLTSTFKFKVLKKEETPEEPKGNRIEYDGKIYELTSSVLFLEGENFDKPAVVYEDESGQKYAGWNLFASDVNPIINTAKYSISVQLLTPLNTDGTTVLPYNKGTLIAGGMLVIDGSPVQLDSSTVGMSFSKGTFDKNNMTGNYGFNIVAKDTKKKDVKVFWDGDFFVVTPSFLFWEIIKL